MVATISGLLGQKWNEWTNGRKIGITIGVDPEKPDGARGGELWQVPIVEVVGDPKVEMSKYPMEYGKVYNDNIIHSGAVVNMVAFVSNGFISQTLSNALQTLQGKLDFDWMKNSIFEAKQKIDEMLYGPVFCDITTNIKVYKNMKLISAPFKENKERGEDNMEFPLTFQEALLFEPVNFDVSFISVNKKVIGNALKTKKTIGNMTPIDKNKLKGSYYINGMGDICIKR